MIFFILGVLIVLAAVIAGIAVHKGAFGFVALGALLIVISCMCQVPAQNTGIITQFGKVTGRVVGPGLHSKAPWQKEVDMDGTIQSLDNTKDSRTVVRLKDNYIMYVENNLRWKIKPEAAPALYQDWRKGGDSDIVEKQIGPGVVHYEVINALNTVLSSYDPLNPGAAGQTNEELSTKVIDQLNKTVGNQITVESFVIVRVDFDDATQARITQVLQAQADTRTAEQREQTAKAEARANKALAESVSNDPNVLVSKCLDIVAKGAPLPAGFSCFGSSNTQVVTPTN